MNKTLSALQEQGRAELAKGLSLRFNVKNSGATNDTLDFLDSYAETVWNAAIDSALEALPPNYGMVAESRYRLGYNLGVNDSREKLSALKSQ